MRDTRSFVTVPYRGSLLNLPPQAAFYNSYRNRAFSKTLNSVAFANIAKEPSTCKRYYKKNKNFLEAFAACRICLCCIGLY
jgi:hypothetical protein